MKAAGRGGKYVKNRSYRSNRLYRRRDFKNTAENSGSKNYLSGGKGRKEEQYRGNLSLF